MGLQFEVAGAQIDGARDYQEDAFLISHLTDAEGRPTALVIVADGMGGHAAGNVASNMAVQAFNKHVTSNYPTDDLPGVLHSAVLKANSSIAETIRETPALEGMGCTMVAVVIEDGKLWWASVGDSHLYLLRDKDLTKKNADHSYGGFLDRMAEAGNPVEPEPGLSRNMLMSAVTGEDITEIDCPDQPLELKAGDRLVLCSDGLDTLSAGKIIQYCDWSEKPKECSDALLKAVEEAAMPRQDNTTVIVIDMVDKAAVQPVGAEAVPEAVSAESEGESTAPHPAHPEIPIVEPDKPRKTGIRAVAAVIVIAAAAGGGYLVWQQLSAPPPEIIEPVAEMVPDEPPLAAPEPAVEPEPEPEVAEIEPIEEPEPVEPEPAVAEPVVTGETFRDDLRSGGRGPEMVWIPAGKFTMGSGRNPEERPQREVSVGRFAMSRYEITFAEYERFARATGRRMPDNMGMDKNTHPVILVTWDDAFYYTEWLSNETGETYRLPSEAEWEYAASTGRDTPYWWGFDLTPGQAHCFGCESGFHPRRPTRVGSFDPNPFGLYDMYGNVAEWVQDCWHENYEGAPKDARVRVGGDCSYRVVRGGSYLSPPPSIRSAKRDRFLANSTYDTIGFRVVREE